MRVAPGYTTLVFSSIVIFIQALPFAPRDAQRPQAHFKRVPYSVVAVDGSSPSSTSVAANSYCGSASVNPDHRGDRHSERTWIGDDSLCDAITNVFERRTSVAVAGICLILVEFVKLISNIASPRTLLTKPSHHFHDRNPPIFKHSSTGSLNHIHFANTCLDADNSQGLWLIGLVIHSMVIIGVVVRFAEFNCTWTIADYGHSSATGGNSIRPTTTDRNSSYTDVVLHIVQNFRHNEHSAADDHDIL